MKDSKLNSITYGAMVLVDIHKWRKLITLIILKV